MPTIPSASRPLLTAFMRAFRTPKNRPPTRCSASRRLQPPSLEAGVNSLEIALGLSDDAADRWEEAMAKGILIAAMDFSAAPEDEFHDWYDLEHIPERLRVPGFFNYDHLVCTE